MGFCDYDLTEAEMQRDMRCDKRGSKKITQWSILLSDTTSKSQSQ